VLSDELKWQSTKQCAMLLASYCVADKKLSYYRDTLVHIVHKLDSVSAGDSMGVASVKLTHLVSTAAIIIV